MLEISFSSATSLPEVSAIGYSTVVLRLTPAVLSLIAPGCIYATHPPMKRRASTTLPPISLFSVFQFMQFESMSWLHEYKGKGLT